MDIDVRRYFCRVIMLGVMGVGFFVLGGCGGKTPSRDFNELIPRLMGASTKSTNPTEAAANMFNVTSPDERRDAIAYLEKQKYGHEPPYMRAYELLTTDSHPMVRAQAIRALGSSKNPAIIRYLIDGKTGKTGLKDPVAEVRRDAAQAMLEVITDEAIRPLVEALEKDPDEQVRVACARALRHAHQPVAIRGLIRALDDRNAAVVYWAHESLMISTGNKFGMDRSEWLTWFEQTYGKAGAPETRG
jgi:HEAT repeat protein